LENKSIRDMTSGSPAKLLLKFMLPLIFGNLFQQVYNMVDTIIVGRFLGVDALAGVGSTGSVGFLVLGFTMGICAGFAIPVSQKFGEKDYDGLRRFVGTAIWLAVIIAAVMTVTTTVLCRQILVWMHNPEDTFEYAYHYIFWIFLGIPASMLYNLLAGVMRALGDSKTPLLFLIFSSCLNVGLDILFIVAFQMGVTGASVATVLAQLISGLLCLTVIVRKFQVLRLHKDDLIFRREEARRLLYIGVPMGLQFSITAIGGTVLQSAVNGLGTNCMAAMTAGNKISLLCDCPLSAIGTAMATFSGQNMGAGKMDRVRRGFRDSTLMGAIFCVVIFAVIYLSGNSLCALFMTEPNPEVLAMCRKFLLINASMYVFLLLVFQARMTIQGLGYSVIVVIAGVLEMFARGGIGIGLVPYFGFDAVCFANPLAWIVADLFLVPLYFVCIRRRKHEIEAQRNLIK